MSFGLPYGVKQRNSEGKLRSINTMHKERYVYYERLYEDAVTGKNKTWPDLAITAYNRAKDVLKWRIDYGSNHEDISGFFANLASYEFAKEEALLEKHFGITSYDPSSEDCGKALIEAYNLILNTREIFERNALLIANTQGQTSLPTHLPTYLNHALKEWIDGDKGQKMKIEIGKKIAEGEVTGEDKTEEVLNFVKKTLDNNTYDIVKDALMKMFSSSTKAETGLKKIVGDEEYSRLGKAYTEVFKAISKVKETAKTNEFVRGMVQSYNLEGFGEMLTNSLSGQDITEGNIGDLIKGFNFDTEFKEKRVRGSYSGIGYEWFGNYLSSLAVTLNSKGTKVESVHTGGAKDPKFFANQKADFALLIGFKDGAGDAMEKKLEKFQGKGRGTNVMDVKNLTKEMFEKFGNDDSFMIYVNSKNYTLNSKFKTGYGDGIGGYSAGTPIDLNTWDDIMHQMNIQGRDFIFTIMQLIPGAIGSPNGETTNKEKVSDMFARAIGSALFDDFEPDDPYRRQGGADFKTIHLLYLNGIYVPLSVFYTLLAQAFGDLKSSLERDDLVQVSFSLPAQIEYPEWDDQKGVEHAWNIQQQIALDNIKVSYHFLRGYKKFLQQFYEITNNK